MRVYAIMNATTGEFLDVDFGQYVPIHEATFFEKPEWAKRCLLPPEDMLEEGVEEVVVPITLVVGEPLS